MELRLAINKIDIFSTRMVRFYLKYVLWLLPLLVLLELITFLWGWGLADAGASFDISEVESRFLKELLLFKFSFLGVQLICIFAIFSCLIILIKGLLDRELIAKNPFCFLHAFLLVLAVIVFFNGLLIIPFLILIVASIGSLLWYQRSTKKNGGDLFG